MLPRSRWPGGFVGVSKPRAFFRLLGRAHGGQRRHVGRRRVPGNCRRHLHYTLGCLQCGNQQKRRDRKQAGRRPGRWPDKACGASRPAARPITPDFPDGVSADGMRRAGFPRELRVFGQSGRGIQWVTGESKHFAFNSTENSGANSMGQGSRATQGCFRSENWTKRFVSPRWVLRCWPTPAPGRTDSTRSWRCCGRPYIDGQLGTKT